MEIAQALNRFQNDSILGSRKALLFPCFGVLLGFCIRSTGSLTEGVKCTKPSQARPRMSLFDGQPLDTQEKIEAHAARMREEYKKTMAKVEAIKKGT